MYKKIKLLIVKRLKDCLCYIKVRVDQGFIEEKLRKKEELCLRLLILNS
jgi:hypothetical protein